MKMFKALSTLFIACTFFLTLFNEKLLFAQEDNIDQKEVVLTIEEAVNIAINNNPLINSKRFKVEAAKGKVKQANLFINPRINLSTEEMSTHEIGLNESENTVSLTQKIEVGGKRKLRKNLAKKQQSIVDLDLRNTARNITADTRKVFFEVLTAQDKLQLANETVEIAQNLKGILEDRFIHGEIAKVEVLKSSIELSKAKTIVTNAKKEMIDSSERLKTVMGISDNSLRRLAPVHIGDAQDIPFEKLENLLKKNHPVLHTQENILDLTLLGVKKAKRDALPDIDFSIGYKRLSANDEDTVQAGISVPFPIFNRNQGKIDEAVALSQKAKYDKQAIENDLHFQLTKAFTMYTASLELVNAFANSIVPQAEESLEIARQAYKHGGFDYIEVLDAQRTFASTKIEYLDILNNLFSAITEIERLVGINISDIEQ